LAARRSDGERIAAAHSRVFVDLRQAQPHQAAIVGDALALGLRPEAAIG
jgi:hypothetical protein